MPNGSKPVALEVLSRDDLPKLTALALVMDAAARRARFGASVSDEFILRHYGLLQWSRYLAVGAMVERRLVCVVEFHAVADDWGAAEATAHGLTGAWMRPGADLMVVACQELLARDIFEVVWVTADACDPWLPILLAASEALGVAAVVRPAW